VQKGFYKKTSFEDKFDRKYACWVANHPAAWKRYKKQNRRRTRRWIAKEMEKDILEGSYEENQTD
jgi:hypothetical protein